MGDLTRLQQAAPVQITDDSAQSAALSTGPAGTEVGLITRNIPYGTQTVAGTGTFTVSVSNTPTVVANAGSGTFTTAYTSATTSTGTMSSQFNRLTANMTGYQGAAFSLTGTWSGTVVPQISFDGSNFINWTVFNANRSRWDSSIIGDNSNFSFPLPGGVQTVAVLMQAYTSGTVTVNFFLTNNANNLASLSVSGTGTNIPGYGSFIAASDGTNLQGLRGSTAAPAGTEFSLITRNIPSGSQTVAAGAGTFTVSVSNSPTVVSNAGSGTFTVAYGSGNFSVVGTKTNNNAAPGTNNIGTLPALANAAAPSWTEGNQVLLSTDLSGNLRVGAHAVNAGSGTFTVSVSNSPTVTANAGTGTFTIAPAVGSVVTGTITTSSSTVTYTVANAQGAYVSVHGTYAGVAFNFQASDDGGTTFYPLVAMRTDGSQTETASGALASNTSRAWFVFFGSANQFQIAATAWTSGTATIRITPVADMPWLSSGGGGGVASTVNQGNPAVGSNAWPVAVTDTSNNIVYPGDSTNNAVRVNIIAGAGSGGTAMADNSAFTAGTTNITPAGGVYNDAIANASSGDAAAVRITQARGMHVNLRNTTGTEIGTAANPVNVNIQSFTPTTAQVMTSNPTGTEEGTVVRNIPSGTQTVAAGAGTFTVAPAVGSVVTGTITASNSTVTYTVANAQGAYVSVHGTYAGVAFNFQASDDGGTTFYPLVAVRTDGSANETATGTLGANTSRAWFVFFGSANQFQIAATAWTSGTANVRITPVAAMDLLNSVVQANAGSGTFTVGGTVTSNAGSGTMTVSVSNSPTVVSNAGSGSFTVAYGSGNFSVVGTKTNNNAAPGTNNIGTLPALANAAAPSWTEGNQVLLSTDLSGNLRVGGTVTATAGSGTFTVSVSNSPTVVANAGSGTFTVSVSNSPTVVANAGSGTFTVGAGAGTFTMAPAVGTTVTGTITTSSSTVTYTVANAQGAYVSVHGTYAGVAFNFQGSDDGGTTFYPLVAVRTDGSTNETATGTLGANTSRAWFVFFGSANRFQIAATAWTSGTASIRITPLANMEPINSVIQANAGSGTFTVAGSVTSNAGSGTMTVSVSNSPTVVANAGSGTFTVSVSNSPAVTSNAGSGTFTVAYGSGNFSVVGTKTNNNAAPGANNIGTLPALANAAAPSWTEGNQVSLSTDLSGNLRVGAHAVNAGSGTFTVSVSNAPTVTANAGSGTMTVSVSNTPNVQGDVASGSANSGNPIQSGGLAKTANPTAVADGQRVASLHDKLGRQIVVNSHLRDLVTTNNITLSNTTETTLLSAVASTFLDLTLLVLSNTSSTAVRVDIRDTTAGTVLLSVELAATGGGAVIPFNPPLPQTSVNTNWTAQLSSAVTDVRIKAIAVKNT